MNKNYFANIDYFNLFEKLNNIQKKFSSELFSNIIKFNKCEEVWKDYISNGNNMIIFFQELSLQNKILFIKYIDYELLDETQRLKTLTNRCLEIVAFIDIFSLKCSDEKLTKIDIVDYYDLLFNQINNERIIKDNGLSYIDDSTDNVNSEVLLKSIINWIEHFNLELSEEFPNILELVNNSIDALAELNNGMQSEMSEIIDVVNKETVSELIDESYEKMKEKRIEDNIALDQDQLDNRNVDMFNIQSKLDEIKIN